MSKNAPGCGWPVSTWCVATRWLFSRWDSERTRAYWSARAARRGRCSQMCTPGTVVAIGLNSPRISGGASGFRSNVSRWLGAPVRKTRITDFGFRAAPSAWCRRGGAPGQQRRQADAQQAGVADLQ